MGVVHRARDTDLQREVALKLISPALAGESSFRTRFEAEARAAAAVDHPNVLPIFEAGEEDGELYLAMRLVEGTDLAAVLVAESSLPPPRAGRIVARIAAALDAAHARNLVHRDVKPANVLISPLTDRDEHVYLTDFGLTRMAGAGGMTTAGQVLGTANYLAPEQIAGDEIDGRVDVYALACVAFELLTGKPPFARETVPATLDAHARAAIPRVSRRVTGASADVDAALIGGLAKRPDDRFASCGAFARALGIALGAETGELPGDPLVAARARPHTTDRPPRRPVAPPPARTAPTAALPPPRRSGGVPMTLLSLLAAAAVGLVGVLLVPSLLEGQDGGAPSEGTLRVLSGAHAIDAELSTLISRLAEDPTDASAREAQALRVAAMRRRVDSLLNANHGVPNAKLRALLRDSLTEQRRLLGQYETVLGANPASAPAAIARMQTTLERIDSRLGTAAGGSAAP